MLGIRPDAQEYGLVRDFLYREHPVRKSVRCSFEGPAWSVEIAHDPTILHEGKLVTMLLQDGWKHVCEGIVGAVDFLPLALRCHLPPPGIHAESHNSTPT